MTSLDGFVPFPASDAARFRAAGYWRGETLASLLRNGMDRGKMAIITGTERLTFGALDDEANRLAGGLAACGIGRGDRVVVQLPNEPAFLTMSTALFRLGALPVYALTKQRRHEIAYLVRHAEACALVIPDTCDGYDHRALAREVLACTSTVRNVFVAGDAAEFTPLAQLHATPVDLPAPAPSDVAFFLLSGGTTGEPKLIPRTHDDYTYQLRATAEALGVDRRSVYLASLPVAHNAALGCPGLLGTLWCGGSVVLTRSLGPDRYFPLIASERVSLTTLMPPVALLWLELAPLFGIDVSRVLLQVGGAPLSPHHARRISTELRARLTHWFGMAEGLLTYTRLEDPMDVVAHTVGRPLCADDEIRVVDDQGREVATGEVGELWTRGPYTIRGYYRAEDHNRRAFQDGFLKTGDRVRLDAAGNMMVMGRIKDVIIRAGEKISAEELEYLIARLPSVREVSIVGHGDETLGERIWAYVVPSGNGATLAELRTHLIGLGVAEYKLPDRVVVVDELPRTKIGKIDKSALRARSEGG